MGEGTKILADVWRDRYGTGNFRQNTHREVGRHFPTSQRGILSHPRYSPAARTHTLRSRSKRRPKGSGNQSDAGQKELRAVGSYWEKPHAKHASDQPHSSADIP